MRTDNNKANNFSFFVLFYVILTCSFIYLMIVNLEYIQHPYLGDATNTLNIALINIAANSVINSMMYIMPSLNKVFLFITHAIIHGILVGFSTHCYYTHGAGIILYLSTISTLLLFGLIFWLIISSWIIFPLRFEGFTVDVLYALFVVNFINVITQYKFLYLYFFTYMLCVLSFSIDFAQAIQSHLFGYKNILLVHAKDKPIVNAGEIAPSIWASWVCFSQIFHLLFYMLTSNSTQTTSRLYASPHTPTNFTCDLFF